MTDIIRRLHCTIRCDIETAASGCHCAEARDTITRLRALNAELVEALERIHKLCRHANATAFTNGVTDSTGSIDEGDVIASKIIDNARAAIAKAERETRTAAMDALIKTDGELL